MAKDRRAKEWLDWNIKYITRHSEVLANENTVSMNTKAITLNAKILHKADVVVADSSSQCLVRGETLIDKK